MKETKYYCDRCKDECHVEQEEYPIQIEISVMNRTGANNRKFEVKDICTPCYLNFLSNYDEWSRGK